MLKKSFFIFIVIFLTIIIGYGQQVDTALVLKHLKIRLFPELQLGLLSNSALNDYNKRELKATILKSKGFENITFFKISSQVLAVDTLKEREKIFIYSTPFCLKNGEECYFVYAFNSINNKFYRLKGTNQNDFEYLYYDLQNNWMYWKSIKKINTSTINQFSKDYWIDGLDLGCLLRSLIGEKGTCLDYFSPKL